MSHQPYASRDFQPDGRQHQKRLDLEQLIRRYPFLQLAYLDWNKSRQGWSSVLLQADGARLAVLQEVALPCDPACQPIVGEGKPENQNHALKFIRGEIVNVRDCNDGMRLEDALKEPNALQEFADDPDLQILGFPEVCQTAPHTWMGKVFAYADRSFAMLGQRFLAMCQVRMHYGRDYMRMSGVRQLGGVSHPGYINEDVFAGLLAILQGRTIKQIEFLQGLKGREVHFLTGAGFLSKLGAGAGQQSVGRVFHAFNNSTVVGLLRAHLYFLACIGFFIRKRMVILTNLAVMFCIVFLGLSGYVSFPNEVLFGYGGLLASQSSSFLGYFQLLSDVPLLLAAGRFLLLLPPLLAVFMAMAYVTADSFGRGIRGQASYVQTGRGYVLEHFAPYLPHPARVRRSTPDGRRLEIDSFCRSYPSLGRWADAALVFGVWAIYLWQSPALLWSTLFLVMPLMAFLTPYFIANHGATPVGVGPCRWFALLREDVGWWLLKLLDMTDRGLCRPLRIRRRWVRRTRFPPGVRTGPFRRSAVMARHLLLTLVMTVLPRCPAVRFGVTRTFLRGLFLFFLIAVVGVMLLPLACLAHVLRSSRRRSLKKGHDRANGSAASSTDVAPNYARHPYAHFPGSLGL
jgi:hypothetical protein